MRRLRYWLAYPIQCGSGILLELAMDQRARGADRQATRLLALALAARRIGDRIEG